MKQGTRLAARILGAYAVIYVAYLYVPVLFLPLFSFNDSIYISFPLRGWSAGALIKLVLKNFYMQGLFRKRSAPRCRLEPRVEPVALFA